MNANPVRDKPLNSFLIIDLLRGLAAMSVYCYHQRLGELLAKTFNLSFFYYLDILGSTYAVPLFFLLSGFCIHFSTLRQLKRKEPLNLRRYYLNRFWRIYPPYILAVIFSIMVNYIIDTTDKVSTNDLITHLFVLQGYSNQYFNSINIVLWTITVEIAFYLVYPLYYLIQLRTNSTCALTVAGIVSLVSILYFQLQDGAISLPERYFFTNLWFTWCFGAWLCDTYFRDVTFFTSYKWIGIQIFIMSVFVSLLTVEWPKDILIKYVVNVVAWAPPLIWLLRSERFYSKKRKWLQIPIALGVSSYSLYLFHEPPILLKNYLIYSYLIQQWQYPMMVFSIFAIPGLCYIN